MSNADPFPSTTAAERLARTIAIVRRATTSAEVVAAIPRAVVELGFERAMFSTVDDEYWRPAAVHIDADRSWTSRILDSALEMPQPIERTVPEQRVITEARPVVVPPPREIHSWSRQHWEYRHPQRVTAYVAAPVVVDGRVHGIIHADRGRSCRAVGGAHASMLWSVCGVIELALAATNTQERWTQVRGHLDAIGELARSRELAPTQGSHRSEAVGDSGFATLTGRERHILDLLSRGLSNAQIADQLVISPDTVKAHVKHILAKTASPNRTAAALKWTRSDAG